MLSARARFAPQSRGNDEESGVELKVDRGIENLRSVFNRFIVNVKLVYGHFVCKKSFRAIIFPLSGT